MITNLSRALLALLAVFSLGGPTQSLADAEPTAAVTRGNLAARIRIELVARRIRSGAPSLVKIKVWGPLDSEEPLRVVVLREGRELRLLVPFGNAGQAATATLRASRVSSTEAVIDYLELDESFTLD